MEEQVRYFVEFFQMKKHYLLNKTEIFETRLQFTIGVFLHSSFSTSNVKGMAFTVFRVVFIFIFRCQIALGMGEKKNIRLDRNL